MGGLAMFSMKSPSLLAFEDGSKTYFHNMLGAVVCHPDLKQVFPLTRLEPITVQDGNKKNDSEQKASLRENMEFHQKPFRIGKQNSKP
jgi:hypothetical protein